VLTDYREMLKEKDIEMVTIAAPNSLYAQMTKDAAAAGKHAFHRPHLQFLAPTEPDLSF
jgi:predicted dehydrogenase